MSSPARTPSRRSRRGQAADEPGTPDSTASGTSTRNTRSGRSTPATPQAKGTPGRKAAAKGTPTTTRESNFREMQVGLLVDLLEAGKRTTMLEKPHRFT